MMSSSSAIQNLPRTQSMMKPKIRRLFCHRYQYVDEGEPNATHEDEMTANIGSARHKTLICRVEMPDVASLHDDHNDPVNAGDDGIEREGCPHVLVLAPYCVASVGIFTILGSIEGVVDRCDHNKEPGDDCQDFVGDERFSAVVLAFDEWVIWN